MIARRPVLAAALLLAAATAASAASGVVTDGSGEPLEGVRACYVAGGIQQLCVESDGSGRWSLPKSSVDRIRLTRDGYLPKEIPGGDHAEPILMHPAAALAVRLVAPDGTPVTSGEVDVLLPSGQRYGPFPIRNDKGTLIRTLDPGPVVILARSAGYAETRAEETELPAGERTTAVIRMQPAEKP